MDMTPQRWENTNAYLHDVFPDEDPRLAGLMDRAVEAGLPAIAVSSDVGRLLKILTSMCGDGRGAERALELGTLAGYSGIWIARGLAPGGRLITIEPEPKHADFAERAFRDAGVAERVEVRRTTALEAITALKKEFGAASFDLLFADAIKSEYPAYFRAARELIRPGGLFIADNALGGGSWWVDEPGESPESHEGAVTLNRLVAADPDFDSTIITNREGLLVARRRKN